MNLRQEKFIDEYLIDFNAARAAIAAGYSSKNAKSQGWRLLADSEIQTELAKRKEALTKPLKITQEQIVHELAILGFSNIFDLIEIGEQEIHLKNELPTETHKAIANIRITKNGIEIRLHDKIRALEQLSRYTSPEDSDIANNLFEMIGKCAEECDFSDIPEMEGQLNTP